MSQSIANAALSDAEPEIEVTPAMIEAGVSALTSELGGVDFCRWDALARSVFLAMCNPAESEPFLSQRCNRRRSLKSIRQNQNGAGR